MDEIKKLIEAQNRDFEEFKRVHNESLKNGDALLKEHVARIDNALSDMEEKVAAAENSANRGGGGGLSESDIAKSEHKDAFLNQFSRKGIEDGLHELAIRADLSVGTDSEGGYTIPEELDRDILRLARDLSPMRQYCTVRTIGGSAYKKLVNLGGTASGWVGEKAERPKTDSDAFTVLTPTFGEVYANPAATQNMLDDAFFDVESEIYLSMANDFTDQENAAFVTGNGTNKPIGLLAGTLSTSDDSTRTFGQLQKIVTGVADALPTNPFDFLQDVMDELKEAHMMNAIWMCARKTRTVLRKIKDDTGNYMWVPAVRSGENPTLFGHEVASNGNFPLIGAGALPLAFGDFKKAYMIIDRLGTSVLRDPYTNKPFVQFYGTKRVGSMLVDSEAIKVVSCEV